MNIFTIGHSTRKINDFIGILKKYKIKCVVDVRSYPGSRKFPQYNKARLKKSLAKNKINYIHIPNLGGRRSTKPSYKTSLKVKAFASYAEYMLSPKFKNGLIELKRIARKCKTAFMCAEALWWQCHRRMISDRLEFDNWKVYHLGLGLRPARHVIWNVARINSKGQIIYDR